MGEKEERLKVPAILRHINFRQVQRRHVGPELGGAAGGDDSNDLRLSVCDLHLIANITISR